MQIAITGASGFVGQALATRLASAHQVVAAARDADDAAKIPGSVRKQIVGDIGPDMDFRPALVGCEVVIHLAARAHITKETAQSPLEAFRAVNVVGSMQLMEQSVEMGVKRVVLVSSIGVHGRGQGLEPNPEPIDESSPLEPEDDYAVSKLEAEEAAAAIARERGLELVVVRPVLVYGPGAPGNFARLIGLVRRGLPLPVGAARNRRSYVSREHLCDLLERAATLSSAAGRTYIAADERPVSTPELIHAIADGLGVSAKVPSAPIGLCQSLAKVAGKQRLFEQLFGSLVASSASAARELGWDGSGDTLAGIGAMAAAARGDQR